MKQSHPTYHVCSFFIPIHDYEMSSTTLGFLFAIMNWRIAALYKSSQGFIAISYVIADVI